MKRLGVLLIVVVMAGFLWSEAQAVPVITVTPALSPNSSGSPSFNTWQTNAINALENGWSSAGTPGTPSFYSVAPSVIAVHENVVSGFPSWDGQANPGTEFGSAYAGEFGNRLLFGLEVDGNGQKVSINNLGFSATSTDPTHSLSLSIPTGSYGYSSAYVGIIFGLGGPTFITSGPNTQLVDMIVGRGSGNAWPIFSTDPGTTQQDKLDGVEVKFTLPDDPFTFTGTYTMNAVSGSATVIFTNHGIIPEPITAGLSVLSLLALAGFVGRRK